MKTKKFLLSLLSTVLLAFGLVSIAERLDPLNVSAPIQSDGPARFAGDCAVPCSGGES